MSFFGGLKRALGWSDDDDEDDYITYNSSAEKTSTTANVKNTVAEEEASSVEVVDFDGEIPEGVFDGLIEIINANLSPMVLKCLDVEAEKKYLYEALGPKFSEFVKSTRENGLSVARAEWTKEKNELNIKIEDFKSRCETAENEMREMKAMKMSEDRQKQALKERLRNLEDQVASAEAEKEQYDLENKSLLNKLKVSQLRTDAVEEAEKEITELKAEILRLKNQPAESGVPQETLDALEEEYKAKMEVSNALVNSLQTAAAKNKADLEASEAVVADLQAKLESANAEIAEMTESLSVLDDIQEQLLKVEDFKKKKNEEVQTLQEKIVALEEEKSALEQEKTALKEVKSTLEQEKAKAIEAVRDEDVLKGRVAELELELSSSADKLSALAQENTDTLEMLRKREDVIEAQKAELAQARADYDALKAEFDTETNALKTAEVETVKKFQAEIAMLQAKLNVSGKIDDALVEDDFRQSVDDTFEVSVGDDLFEDFHEPLVEGNIPIMEDVSTGVVEETPVEYEAETSKEVIFEDSTPEAEIDDIDWLLPDTVDSVAQEEEAKKKKEKEREEQEEQENAKAASKAIDEPDAQMSLFG